MNLSKISEFLAKIPELLKKNVKNIAIVVTVIIVAIIGYYAVKTVITPKPDFEFSVSLSRGACFGACPMYSIKMDGRGTVTFRGERFTKVVGERVYNLDVQKALALRDYLREQKMFEFKARYEQRATDLPSFTIVVNDQGKEKQIYVYGARGISDEVPAVLFDIADYIDESMENQSLVVR